MPDKDLGPYSSLNNTGYPQNYLGSVIQSPKLDGSNVPQQRSIRDVSMARDVIKTVVMAGRNRQIVNSRILAKYNAERPYDSSKLEAEGLGWRQNFTTKPLPSMIEKVGPRFVAAIDGLRYFTNSALSPKWQNNVEKTDKFRKAITTLCRSRAGWRTLIEDIAFNDALFGHSILACLDEYTWFPRHFQQDESFVADGTKADPRFAQIVVLKEILFPFELFASIKDKEAAELAGYNIDNTRDAINRASPQQVRDRLNVGGTLETWYQNALRELTIGASYMAGASVIVVYNLLVQEIDGKVSHYRVAGPEMLEIQTKEDRFESMEDTVNFYSFQKGNGTLHGSKGIGRDIYELAGMIDRTRNEVVDRLIMSGKTLVQGDIRRVNTFKMHVIGSTVILPNNWTIIEHKLDGNVEPFLKLDAYFTQLVNELIGSTSPPRVDVGEGMRSPAAWNLLAQREEEGQDVRISRFLEQFAMMMQSIQRRACDPETVESDAKEMQKELLKVMSREELDELAAQPVSGTVKDLTPLERQLRVALAQEKKGNPLYNQRALEEADLTARLGSDFVEQVLLPDADPTEHAEQDRMQNLEMLLLMHGHPVAVSPRDNHMIHLQVLMPSAQQMAQHLMDGQFDTASLEAILAHLNEHYNLAVAQGVKKEMLAPVAALVKQIGPALAQLKQLDAQAELVKAQHDQLMAGGGVPPEAPQQQPQMQ